MTECKPKYRPGTKIGDLTILYHGGWSKTHQETGREGWRGQWHYRCECVCGEHEWLSQRQLETRKYCQNCLSLERKQRWADIGRIANRVRAGEIAIKEARKGKDPFLTLRTGNERIHRKILRYGL